MPYTSDSTCCWRSLVLLRSREFSDLRFWSLSDGSYMTVVAVGNTRLKIFLRVMVGGGKYEMGDFLWLMLVVGNMRFEILEDDDHGEVKQLTRDNLQILIKSHRNPKLRSPELTEGLTGRRKKPVLASLMVWGGPH
ncbi:hypothetical protein DVH24_004290 [Malus domestica]|uniref:Uncharacterized protein n=1 Tax=Malus domestica TaxID=3750 RepID=A0A498K898_MALDO|nr:hypothetical protein DVH24_004290 [Malus domestica]